MFEIQYFSIGQLYQYICKVLLIRVYETRLKIPKICAGWYIKCNIYKPGSNTRDETLEFIWMY